MARDSQAFEELPEQEGVGGVKEDIVDVVTDGRIGPEVVFDPPGGLGEGVVLMKGVDVEPDLVEAFEGAEMSVLGDMEIVVPDELGAKGGGEGDDDQENEEGAAQKGGGVDLQGTSFGAA
jgi:hypothetical protein